MGNHVSCEESDLSNIYFTISSSTADYAYLSSLDVLGPQEDLTDQNETFVFKEIQEQLPQSNEGWFETGHKWKAGHKPLPTNKKKHFGTVDRFSVKAANRA